MSLFIAGVAFPDATVYAAAKIAIFLASLIAGTLGTDLVAETCNELFGELK